MMHDACKIVRDAFSLRVAERLCRGAHADDVFVAIWAVLLVKQAGSVEQLVRDWVFVLGAPSVMSPSASPTQVEHLGAADLANVRPATTRRRAKLWAKVSIEIFVAVPPLSK